MSRPNIAKCVSLSWLLTSRIRLVAWSLVAPTTPERPLWPILPSKLRPRSPKTIGFNSRPVDRTKREWRANRSFHRTSKSQLQTCLQSIQCLTIINSFTRWSRARSSSRTEPESSTSSTPTTKCTFIYRTCQSWKIQQFTRTHPIITTTLPIKKARLASWVIPIWTRTKESCSEVQWQK